MDLSVVSELEIFVDFLRKGDRDDWAPLTSNERLLASIDPSSTPGYDEWKEEMLGSPPTMPRFDRKRPGDNHRRSRSGMSDAPSSSEGGGGSSVTGGSPREPKSFVSAASTRSARNVDEDDEMERRDSKDDDNSKEDESTNLDLTFERIDPSKIQSSVTHLGNALKALETKIKVDFACPDEKMKPKSEVISVYSKCSVKQAISTIIEHCNKNRPDLKDLLKEKNPLRYELVMKFDDFVMESTLDFDKPINNFTGASSAMQGFQIQSRSSTPSSSVPTPREGDYSFEIDLNGIAKGVRGLHSPFSMADIHNKSVNVTVRSSPFSSAPTLWNLLAKLQETEDCVQIGYEYDFGVTQDLAQKHEWTSAVNILHMDTELSVLKCLGVKKLLLTWKVYKDDPSLFKQIRAMHNTIGGFGGPKNASKPSLGSNKGSRTGSLDWLGLRMEHYMALHSNLSGHVKQEWNVIKVNQRGKEQERCIGVDMQYIYNRKRKDVSVSSWLDFGGVRRKQRPVKNIKRVGFGRYSGGRKDSGERIALDIVSLDMVNSRSEASRPLRAFYIRYHDGYVQYYAETPDEAAQILAKIQWVRENRGEDRVATSRSSSSRSLLLHESSYERGMSNKNLGTSRRK